ncbi:hypothetical protein BG011_000159 [Mortierella polycephala]|uniref:FAD-binding domain-containing protein n=1 Tax=Mortierella polycephala TaxID=41804 RepID=A0A9P6U6X2_9FUNG|nr:hypothetical protein BG011_000159 [Mortierella polycephala]
MTNNDTQQLPRVIIVGAGLGGIALGIFLDRLKIPFHIYERAEKVKPLGSVMGFTASTLMAFEQLGLVDEIRKLSLPTSGMMIYNEKLDFLGDFSTRETEGLTGYPLLLFPRPDLYALLFSQIPAERISLGAKVTSVDQNDSGVTITLQDGTQDQGDILIGADGAYSAVRQGLYKQLESKGLLPDSDKENLHMGHVCMVGTTGPLDPAKYPVLKEETSHFHRVLGPAGTAHSWLTANTRGNRIAWSLAVQLGSSTEDDDTALRNSEWNPKTNESMIQTFRDYPVTVGGTLGELIDATAPDMISRVALEEKLFETWHHGRTFLPSAGQGAQSAIQDALILANCFNDMTDKSTRSIEAALASFHEHRYPIIQYQMQRSDTLAKLMYGQTWKERLLRYVIFNWIPKSVQTSQLQKDMSYRPQANFLPLAETKGSGPVQPQWDSKKKTDEIEQSRVAV